MIKNHIDFEIVLQMIGEVNTPYYWWFVEGDRVPLQMDTNNAADVSNKASKILREKR